MALKDKSGEPDSCEVDELMKELEENDKLENENKVLETK